MDERQRFQSPHFESEELGAKPPVLLRSFGNETGAQRPEGCLSGMGECLDLLIGKAGRKFRRIGSRNGPCGFYHPRTGFFSCSFPFEKKSGGDGEGTSFPGRRMVRPV